MGELLPGRSGGTTYPVIDGAGQGPEEEAMRRSTGTWFGIAAWGRLALACASALAAESTLTRF
jgi:hypothetical protein